MFVFHFGVMEKKVIWGDDGGKSRLYHTQYDTAVNQEKKSQQQSCPSGLYRKTVIESNGSFTYLKTASLVPGLRAKR